MLDENSGAVTLNLQNIFDGHFTITWARETLLGANVFIGDDDVDEITLRPLEIKTFIIKIQYS